jgi:hypothetical protein
MSNVVKIAEMIQIEVLTMNLLKAVAKQSQWARLLCQHIRQILVTYTHQGGGVARY